jgi:3'(2'), 5'-bisphosphate nucleotidase
MPQDHSDTLIDALLHISLEAGAEIMRIYAGEIDIRTKDDASPVTDADEAAEKIILAGLAIAAPHIPVVAEESAAAGHIPDISGGIFFLVDPLDGTKEFISKNGEFTVNIALIENGIPISGVVYAPAIGTIYAGTPQGAFMQTQDADGHWGDRQAITVRAAPAEGLTVVASRSHRSPETDDFIAQYDVADIRSAGSSLKLCLLAAAEADLYPRLGRTMEWDIGAGHAVLRAAGGNITLMDGTPFTYGKAPIFENPYFIAAGFDNSGNIR